MSTSENYSNSHSLYSDNEERLLQELMPKLGMDATEPTGHYKRVARIRYLLPRIAVLLLLCVLWGLAFWYLTLPAEIKNLRTQQTVESAEVDFDVNRVLLLENVSATLDGRPVAVEWDTVGEYRVGLDKNGELVITSRTFTGTETQETVSIGGIDEEPPHISQDALVGGDMCIYLTDGDGTGVNWDTLKATTADTGEEYPISSVDEAAGCFSFPFPEASVRIYVEDQNANPLTMLLQILPGDEEETAAP